MVLMVSVCTAIKTGNPLLFKERCQIRSELLQVSIGVSLIGGQAWSGAGLCPNSRPAVLLSQSGLVLEPDLDPLGLGQTGYVGGQCAREVFLNASITHSSCLGCRGRPQMCEKDSAASRSEIVRSL